jgi:hypothetical protein
MHDLEYAAAIQDKILTTAPFSLTSELGQDPARRHPKTFGVLVRRF